MSEQKFNKVDFYKQAVYLEDCFAYTIDENKKTLMVVEPDYTDFNAVLVYLEDQNAVRIYPRWQTNFILKEDGIYIIRESVMG